MCGKQINNLICRIGDASLLHSLLVISKTVYHRAEPLRQCGSGKKTDPFDLASAGNRHDSRNHRNRDPLFPDPVQKVVQDGIIKKHLCGQKVHATVYLVLQVNDVIVFMLCFHMSFRIAGSSNAEISLPFDILDQLAGIPIVIRQRKVAVLRNIPPQRQNIFNPLLLQFIDHLMYGFLCR